MSRSLEDRAREFAVKRHGGQRYDKDKPYAHHLEAVRDVLVRFGVTDEDLLAAAWLHDVVEDTSTSAQQVSERFGDRVGALVLAVTNEPGKNRRARHLASYPKIPATPGATTLKLADRIANVEQGGALVGMYRKEHPEFRKALHAPKEAPQMWAWLDGLLA